MTTFSWPTINAPDEGADMNPKVDKRLTKLSGRRLAIYLFAMTMSISVLLCAAFIIFRYGWLKHTQLQQTLTYNTVGLALNYIEFGGVRRGLIGTIIYLSGFNLIYAPFALYVVSSVVLVVVSFFILVRMIVPASECLPFLIVLAALLLFWSTDIGRADILVAVLLVAAALALANGRVALATSFITVGVLVHEESAIFGFPLLAALLIDKARCKRLLNRRSLTVSGTIITAGVIVYTAIMALPHPNNRDIVATITSENRSIRLEDLAVQSALYAALGGIRAERAALCTTAGWNHLAQLIIALIIIAATLFTLGQNVPLSGPLT
jgi:hypothetical protein